MVRRQPRGLWNIPGPLTPSLSVSQLSHAGSSHVLCERFLLRSADQRGARPLPCPVPGRWPSSWARQTPVRAQGPARPGALRDVQPCSRGWAAGGQEGLLEAGPPPPRRAPTAPRPSVCLPGRGWGAVLGAQGSVFPILCRQPLEAAGKEDQGSLEPGSWPRSGCRLWASGSVLLTHR